MNTKTVSASVAILMVVAIAIFYFAAGGYGKVSPKTYQCATALYGACMAKDAIRLDRVEAMVMAGGIPEADDGPTRAKSDEMPMSEREKSWLLAIINQARAGSWKSAAASAKKMMEDQVDF